MTFLAYALSFFLSFLKNVILKWGCVLAFSGHQTLKVKTFNYISYIVVYCLCFIISCLYILTFCNFLYPIPLWYQVYEGEEGD